MIFDSFTFLGAAPVHEQSEPLMDHEYRYDHVAENPKRRYPGQEADDEPDPPEKLGADGEKRERSGDAKLLSEKSHSSAKSVAAKPA